MVNATIDRVKKVFMQARRAFTLVELLVVIAILAVLLSILLPAIQGAKQKAGAIVCVANQRSLLIGVNMYCDDSGDRLPMADPGSSPTPWVTNPNSQDLQEKKDAITRGSLWKYVDDIKVYHCPQDKREFDNNNQAYVTYDMPSGINAGYRYSGIVPVEKRTQIKFPEEKYFFVESYDPRGYNMGSWAIHKPWNLNRWDWEDALALWHIGSTTLGFGDGHAEIHVWADTRTVDYFAWVRDTKPGFLSSTVSPWPWQVDNPDLIFMKMGFAYDTNATPQY